MNTRTIGRLAAAVAFAAVVVIPGVGPKAIVAGGVPGVPPNAIIISDPGGDGPGPK